jgi:hypothetical protein
MELKERYDKLSREAADSEASLRHKVSPFF